MTTDGRELGRLRLPRLAEPAPAPAAGADRRARTSCCCRCRRGRRSARGRDAPARLPAHYVRARDARQARRGAAAPARARGLPPAPILCADTTVALGRTHPRQAARRGAGDRDAARLSGRTHRVLTAVALCGTAGRSAARAERLARALRRAADAPRSRATSRAASRSARPAPMRSRARRGLDRAHRGSYSGIMGLPLYETAQLLRQAHASR